MKKKKKNCMHMTSAIYLLCVRYLHMFKIILVHFPIAKWKEKKKKTYNHKKYSL